MKRPLFALRGIGMAFGLAAAFDGNLLVSDMPNDRLLRFSSADGACIDTFVPFRDGGLIGPIHVIFAAIPEPGTHTLVMIGLAGILGLYRRHWRK